MNRFVKIIFLILSVNVFVLHGMDISSEEDSVLEESVIIACDDTAEAGDFTPLFADNILQRIRYLYNPLPVNCTAEYFRNRMFRNMLHDMRRTNQESLIPFGITCKRLWFLTQEYMNKNKEILNNLIFELLRPSKHTDLTALNIGICITAGADINYRNEWDETPLMYAISTPSAHKFIEVFIKEGAEVNEEGVLEKAVYHDDYNILELFAQYGSKVIDMAHVENLRANFKRAIDLSQKVTKNAIRHAADSGYEADSDSSKSNEVTKVPKSIKTKPAPNINKHTLEEEIGHGILHSISADALPIFVGVVAAGCVCYWLYAKYIAYKAEQEPESDEPKKEEVTIAITSVK